MPIIYHAFDSTLSFVSMPKCFSEAFSHPRWQQAIIDDMLALEQSGTSDLVPLPPRKIVRSQGVYYQVGLDGNVEHLKPNWLLKGYTQTYGLHYSGTHFQVLELLLYAFYFPWHP